MAPVAEIVRDPTTAAFYPLSADAIKALDAIEYITEYLKEEEEYKIVSHNFVPGRQLLISYLLKSSLTSQTILKIALNLQETLLKWW